MSQLHASTEFGTTSTLPRGWEEDVFMYCTFHDLVLEGRGFSGALIGCEIENTDWYWGMFNTASFVNVTFRRCVFRGTGMAGCTFTECRFIDCQFIKDNLGGDCSFDDTRWYGCEQANCEGFVSDSLVPRTGDATK